jgi:glucosamine--fructose-6-phosphate aminotransferase (isomerizing)
MTIMLEEIYEQPQAVARMLERETAKVARLVEALREREVRQVVVAARGTSDHAATYAKYLIEICLGIPVSLAAPSVYTLYDATVNLSNALVIGISQSGQALDVVQTLSSARAAGAITASITNVEDSAITEVSDFALYCRAGEERAVAATKTYVTSLGLIALLVGQWANKTEILNGLKQLPAQIEAVLPLHEQIAQTVERYRYIEECAVLARGLNQATALEAALKMTETSYLVAKAYSMADFLHGPIAIVSEGFPCFLFAPDGRAYPSMVDLALKLRERGAEMVIFAHSPEILDLATRGVALPVTLSEFLSPLLYIVPGQLWANYLSLARGQNPDRPRGLSKVTLTR